MSPRFAFLPAAAGAHRRYPGILAKTQLTYAQGACVEMTAAATTGAFLSRSRDGDRKPAGF